MIQFCLWEIAEMVFGAVMPGREAFSMAFSHFLDLGPVARRVGRGAHARVGAQPGSGDRRSFGESARLCVALRDRD